MDLQPVNEESGSRTWTNVHVLHVRSGQPRPYADSTYEYIVTFTGGTPSSKPGFELPFGVPAGKHEKPKGQVFSSPPFEVQEANRIARIKEKCRVLTHDWSTDSTLGEPRKMGGTWLDKFACIDEGIDGGGRKYSAWRLIIITPYMD